MQTSDLENKSRNPATKNVTKFAVALLFILGAMAFSLFFKNVKSLLSSKNAPPGHGDKVFSEKFHGSRAIGETGKMSESIDSDWWVNSGGLLLIEGGLGKTMQGDLSPESEWYAKYKKNNPVDTDEGLHPQNIFRLVTRGKWDNLMQSAYFRIKKINISASENRNESNGILLFNRYQSGDELYYVGLRVDGSAIIKKKYGGKYFTLKESKYFKGQEYDKDENPNLLPLNKWIGMRSELRNTADGDVDIKLFVDVGRTGDWKLAASVTDDGNKDFGKNIISDEGHAGIRTDFMDVEFSDFRIEELEK